MENNKPHTLHNIETKKRKKKGIIYIGFYVEL